MAARTMCRPLLCRGSRKLQQFGESGSCDPMHSRARHHFDGLQIQNSGLATASEEHVQPLVYFAGDFLMDRNSRFFSSCVHVLSSDSTGRCRQIFSLTAISSRLSFWKRWYSPISDWALRHEAGEGKDS